MLVHVFVSELTLLILILPSFDSGGNLPSQSLGEHDCQYLDLFLEVSGNQGVIVVFSGCSSEALVVNVEAKTEDTLDVTEVEPVAEGGSWLLQSSSNSFLSFNPSLYSVVNKEKGAKEIGKKRAEQTSDRGGVESSKEPSG